MKIVYYFEPWIELGRPYLRYHNLRYQIGPQISALVKEYKDINISVVIGEGTYAKCLSDGYTIKNVEFHVLYDNELREIFPNYLDASIKTFHNTASDDQSLRMASLVQDKLGDGFQPDLLISFLSPASHFQKIWPDAAILYTEFGIFSRAPFPRTFYFDPFGMFHNSYIGKFENELREQKISSSDQRHLNLLRNKVESGLNDIVPNLHKELKSHGFKKNILLPMQFSGYFGFDACSDYSSQFEMLFDVLKRTPSDIGIIATEHGAWPSVIDDHNIDFLKQSFRNLIIPENFKSVNNLSQLLLPIVDGVASVSSSVGLQSVFFGKPLLALGKSHLNTFSSGNIENTTNILDGSHSKKFDGAINHLLRSYYHQDNIIYSAEWARDFYQKAVQKHRSGHKDFNYFSPSTANRNFYSTLGHALRIEEFKSSEQGINAYNDIRIPQSEVDQDTATLNNYDIISFDIFDTLIQRPLMMPHQLFQLMQEEVRKLVDDPHLNFHSLRRRAENLTRSETDKDEVSIEEIYEVLCQESGIPYNICEKIMELEWQYELKFCEPRPYGKILFDIAKRLDKKIILISDFYFGEYFIKTLLEKNGFEGYKNIFISCDVRLSKRSGLLFDHVLRTLNIRGTSIIHIGDNYKSDIENSSIYDISSLHLPKGSDLFFRNKSISTIWKNERQRNYYPSDELHNSTAVMLGLIINNLYGDPRNKDMVSAFNGDAKSLGYSLMGPIILGFILFLRHEVRMSEVEKLLFLSRDGYLLKRAYDIVESTSPIGIPYEYILASRKAFTSANLVTKSDLYAALTVPFKPSTIDDILSKKFSIDPSLLTDQALSDIGIVDRDTIYHPIADATNIRNIVEVISDDILDLCKKKRAAAQQYYMQYIPNNAKVGLVDIGYSGSVHKQFKALIDVDASCFFLLTNLQAKKLHRSGTEIKGFLGQFIDHTSPDSPFFGIISLLETMCGSYESSLEHFEIDEGSATPQFSQLKPSGARRRTQIRKLHDGALEFVSDFIQKFDLSAHDFDLSPELTMKWLRALVLTPTRGDALVFNNIEHDDSFGGHDNRYIIPDVTKLIKKMNGRVTVKQAKSLISQSDWKNGTEALLPKRRSTPSSANYHFIPVKLSVYQQALPLRSEGNKLNFHTFSAITPTPRVKMSSFQRKMRKLRQRPKAFFQDAKNPLLKKMSIFFSEA